MSSARTQPFDSIELSHQQDYGINQAQERWEAIACLHPERSVIHDGLDVPVNAFSLNVTAA